MEKAAGLESLNESERHQIADGHEANPEVRKFSSIRAK